MNVTTIFACAASAVVVIGGLATAIRYLWRAVTDDIRDDISEIRKDSRIVKHLVAYHLGPNGTTKPMWKRIGELERVHGIEDKDK